MRNESIIRLIKVLSIFFCGCLISIEGRTQNNHEFDYLFKSKNYHLFTDSVEFYLERDSSLKRNCTFQYMVGFSYFKQEAYAKSKFYLKQASEIFMNKKCVDGQFMSTTKVLTNIILAHIGILEDSCDLALNYLSRADSIQVLGSGQEVAYFKRRLGILRSEALMCKGLFDSAIFYIGLYALNYHFGESDTLVKASLRILRSKYSAHEIRREYEAGLKKIVFVRNKVTGAEQYYTTFFGKKLFIYNSPIITVGTPKAPKLSHLKSYYKNNLFYKQMIIGM